MAKPIIIKQPTLRKVLNRGFTPIRYHVPGGYFRHGWLTGAETRLKVQVVFVGSVQGQWIRKEELAYITEL